METERILWQEINSNAGLASIWRLRELGVDEHLVRRLIKRGALRRVSYGIVAATGAPETWRFLCHLGLIMAGPRMNEPGIRAALCKRTAAAAQDMIEPLPVTEPIHIVTTRRMTPKVGFSFHFSSRLPENELIVVDGFPMTDPLRTYIDMCDSEPHRALSIYRRSLRKGLFTPEAAADRLARESRQGRQGIVAARDAVLSTRPDAARAKSALEDKYADLLVEAGYPPPARNVKIRGTLGFEWEVDLLYRSSTRCAGFEISPVATHSDPDVVRRDQRKTADLKTVGVDIISIGDDISDGEFLRLARALLGPPESYSNDSVQVSM